MLYMVIEHFKDGNGISVYRRFRERGRMAPPGLDYVSSWVETTYARCFQVMQTEDARLVDEGAAELALGMIDRDARPLGRLEGLGSGDE